MMRDLTAKRVDEVMGKCIDFNGEFHCSGCRVLQVPVCVNMGRVEIKGEWKVYCSRDFPEDCSKYGCPKYSFVGWLEHYRNTGSLQG